MIALLCAFLFGFAEPTEAEIAYQEGRYERALTLFAEALERGRGDESALLYNMGNCAFQMGRYAEARLHYERALLRSPRDADIKNKIGATRFAVNDRDHPRDYSSAEGHSPDYASSLLVLCAALQTIGLLGLILARRMRWIMVIMILFGLLAGMFAFEWTHPQRAIVLGDAITVRAEPHSSSAGTTTLRLGEDVSWVDASDRWVRIYTRGKPGWVERSHLGLID